MEIIFAHTLPGFEGYVNFQKDILSVLSGQYRSDVTAGEKAIDTFNPITMHRRLDARLPIDVLEVGEHDPLGDAGLPPAL